MSGLARIKYYKGQVLTARDFEDQQEYHRQKQRQLLQRFSSGIIGGLEVICDPNSFDSFLIKKGLAVDPDGNEIIVSEDIKVPVAKFQENRESPYLGLEYSQQDIFVGDSPCDGNQKNNRIQEGFAVKWDKAPNLGLVITVAHIQQKKAGDTEPGPSCDSYDIFQADSPGGMRIRIDARLVDSDQIRKNAITEEKLLAGAVTKDKIAANAITAEKLDQGAVTENKLSSTLTAKLVTEGNGHNHTGGHGAVIPESGLHQAVQDKLVTGGDAHNHNGGDGAPIPEGGLEAAVTAKLVAGGATHTHTGGQGAPIPEAGLEAAVQAKLVTGGNLHDHSGAEGVPIPEAGLNALVQAKLVTGGNTHDHNGGDGAPIPEGGLENAVKAKLVTGGNTHDHNGGDGAPIPEGGLAGAVKAKLVTGGDTHTHIGGQGAAITRDALAPGAVTADKLSLVTDLFTGTVSGTVPSEIPPISGVPQNAIIQVIPNIPPGILSWTYSVEGGGGGTLTYRITITIVGTGPVGYKVRGILFN